MTITDRITWNQWANVSPAEVPYKKNHQALSIENDVIILGTRPLIPEILRTKMIKIAHESHFGTSTMKYRLRRNVWWPGMDRDVEDYVRRCSVRE